MTYSRYSSCCYNYKSWCGGYSKPDNQVSVSFTNEGSTNHYVVENTNLANAFGVTNILGSSSVSDDVTGGNVQDLYYVPPAGGRDYDLGGGNVNAAYKSGWCYKENYYFETENWNDVKNISVVASGEKSIKLVADNFVQVDVDFSAVDAKVLIKALDAKRGNYLTGDGNDTVYITTVTNGEGWSGIHKISTGDGNDKVIIGEGDTNLLGQVIGGTQITYVDGRWTTVEADLGDGRDRFDSRDVMTRDYVDGGAGRDRIYTGGGDDELYGGTDYGNVSDLGAGLYDLLSRGDTLAGGEGADKFIYEIGDGFDHILDFADEDILEVLVGGGDVVDTVSATLQTYSGDLTGTMVTVNGDAAVFLENYFNDAEIFV